MNRTRAKVAAAVCGGLTLAAAALWVAGANRCLYAFAPIGRSTLSLTVDSGDITLDWLPLQQTVNFRTGRPVYHAELHRHDDLRYVMWKATHELEPRHATTFRAPLWTPLAAAALLTMIAVGFIVWRRAGRCVACGYDLTGAPTPRCPECGAGGAASVSDRPEEKRPRMNTDGHG